MLHEIEEDEK